MQPVDFCYFLQGFLEISDDNEQELSAHQVQIIKDHLALVFKKETPTYGVRTAVSVDGYGIDYGGIRLMGDRIQDGWPGGIPYYTGIEEAEKDIYTEVIPHTPVEITQTYDGNKPVETITYPFIQWNGPQVSC